MCIKDFACVLMHFVAVYGNPIPSTRHRLWFHLDSIDKNTQVSWLVASDFNALLSSEEKRSGSLCRMGVCKEFAYWFFNSSMVDLGFRGPKHTWQRDWLFKRLDNTISNGFGMLDA